MMGISVAAKKEWEAVLNHFNVNLDDCNKYPFGEYFIINLYKHDLLFYRCGARKMNSSASTQYMIDHFNLSKIIVIGTCAGIDDIFKPLDIFIPNIAVQYDCTVREIEPLIKDSFTVRFKDEHGISCKSGVIGTADKPVVMYEDYLMLKNNGITIADTEAAAIAHVCKANNVECAIIKGISDFPIKEQDADVNDSYNEQLNTFLSNIPIIMNNIIDNYLEHAVCNNFGYLDN